MSGSLLLHGLQHTRLHCPSLPCRVCSNSCPLSWWCYLTISSSASLFSCPLILPNIRVFFQWVSSSHQVSKILELQLQYQSFQWIFRVDYLYNWLVWSPCSSRDSQESSSAPQFESFNYLALSFLYVTTLISIYDHWKNHSFNYSTFVGKTSCLLFNTLSRFVIAFLARSKHPLISRLQ